MILLIRILQIVFSILGIWLIFGQTSLEEQSMYQGSSFESFLLQTPEEKLKFILTILVIIIMLVLVYVDVKFI